MNNLSECLTKQSYPYYYTFPWQKIVYIKVACIISLALRKTKPHSKNKEYLYFSAYKNILLSCLNLGTCCLNQQPNRFFQYTII
jgi:hypothetical protein